MTTTTEPVECGITGGVDTVLGKKYILENYSNPCIERDMTRLPSKHPLSRGDESLYTTKRIKRTEK